MSSPFKKKKRKKKNTDFKINIKNTLENVKINHIIDKSN